MTLKSMLGASKVAVLLVLLGGLSYAIVTYLDAHFGICTVNSDSMWPTLLSGQRLLISRFTDSHNSPRRGDIVVVAAPTKHGLAVKRLIGLPGDTVSLHKGDLFVNGKQIEEPYAHWIDREHRSLASWPSVAVANSPVSQNFTVPEFHVFVLGDNRDLSIDSRVWGPLPQEAIYGKRVCLGCAF